MTQLVDIMQALAEPFAIEEIGLLPKGKYEREGKTICMAMPFADPRAYQDRLNKLAYGEWQTPPPIALTVGDKLICYVTVIICGIAHTDCGEAEPGDNQGTEAWSQGFKRACSQFGLGRYLYDLEKAWTPFDVQRKRIDLDEAGQLSVVRKMYQKAGLLPAPQPAQNGNGHGKATDAPTIDELYALFKTLYNDESKWGAVLQYAGVSQVDPQEPLSPAERAKVAGVLEAKRRDLAKKAK
jgi:hypothetical protein